MGKFEKNIINIIENILEEKAEYQKTFNWLTNNHLEVKDNDTYILLDRVFQVLNGDREELNRKQKRKLRADTYFSSLGLIIEIDELQHFTTYRLKTLDILKKANIHVGYDINAYMSYCQNRYDSAIKKGQAGYRKATREFPYRFGRAMQRAYFDVMRDILIPSYLGKPIFRLSEIELEQCSNIQETSTYIQSRLKSFLNSYI